MKFKIFIIPILLFVLVVSLSMTSVFAVDFSDIQDEIDSGTSTINLGSNSYSSGSVNTIVVNRSNVVINGSSVSSKAVLDGSGSGSRIMRVSGDNVRLENLVFVNADVDIVGSALSSVGVNLTVVNCEFKNNRGYSGPISLGNSSLNAVIQNCVFSNNIASPNTEVTGSGAALISHSSNARIVNCVFKDNYASKAGGALCFASGTNNTVKDCNFVNNSAPIGGAIWTTTSGTTLSIVSSNFSSNKATNNGGVIYSVNLLSISNSNFVSNSAKNNGGSVYVTASTNIIGSKFTGNSANYGSAIYSSNNLNVTSTSFNNNKVRSQLLIRVVGGNVDPKGRASVQVSLNSGNNVLNGIYSGGTVIVNGKAVNKNSGVMNQKIFLTLGNKKYNNLTNNQGMACFYMTIFNVNGNNLLKADFSESSLLMKSNSSLNVKVSQKTANKKMNISTYVFVSEYVITRHPTKYIKEKGKIKKVKKLKIASYNNISTITSTIINGVTKTKTNSTKKNYKSLVENVPSTITSEWCYCTCARKSYNYQWKNTFKNKCPISSHANNKKSSVVKWNPKKTSEGEWTCSGCSADFCGVTGYVKLTNSKTHLILLKENKKKVK